jgi:hypothetical protein
MNRQQLLLRRGLLALRAYTTAAMIVTVLILRAGVGESAPSPVGESFFEQKIRPVLAEHCYKCHSMKATKLKGGLALDSSACEKNGLIEFLTFHPKNDWLLAGGGGEKGVLMFIDPNEKKIFIENEAPMHIHKMALDEDCRRLFAAGHKKLAIFAADDKA